MKLVWDSEELAKVWSLKFAELNLLKGKAARSCAGFCAQLQFYQHAGRFPERASDIPSAAAEYLLEQLLMDPADLVSYDWSGRIGQRHRKEILGFLGVRRRASKSWGSRSEPHRIPGVRRRNWVAVRLPERIE